jgi:hypothetical protein
MFDQHSLLIVYDTRRESRFPKYSLDALCDDACGDAIDAFFCRREFARMNYDVAV